MTASTKTTVNGDYTVEIAWGTAQDIVDRIASLLTNRLWNINIFIRGFTYDARGSVEILLRYITTPP